MGISFYVGLMKNETAFELISIPALYNQQQTASKILSGAAREDCMPLNYEVRKYLYSIISSLHQAVKSLTWFSSL
jgi:hypothetical protein